MKYLFLLIIMLAACDAPMTNLQIISEVKLCRDNNMCYNQLVRMGDGKTARIECRACSPGEKP